VKKLSLTIAGHPTSIALEPEFIDALKHFAARRQESLSTLVTAIDATRDPAQSLASTLRVWILHQLTKP
jgi:predicted DNA-binding ribbon-helix-helix protein